MLDLHNPISGKIEVIDSERLMAMADTEVRDTLAAMARGADVVGIMVYECLDLSSKLCGHKTFMVFGPVYTYKTAEVAAAGHLGSVPSQFHYPKYVWLK